MTETTRDLKVVIVTGAASGIGAACATTLASEGYVVSLLDRNESGLERVASQIHEKGHRCVTCPADLLVDASISAAIEKSAASGVIAGLVNAAGIHSLGTALDISLEEWDLVIAIKLRGYFLTSRAVLPRLIANGGGSIVNISSLSGRTKSVFASPAYAASNAGIIGLTMTMAAQTAAQGVRINCVAPGLVETPMIDLYTPEQSAAIRAAIPMKRSAKPEEIAKVVAFLMSDAASYITGETINVNGGVFML